MTPGRFLRVALVLLVAAVVLGVAGHSVTVDAIAFACFGVAGVLAVAAAFLAVGLSEDRDRARRSS